MSDDPSSRTGGSGPVADQPEIDILVSCQAWRADGLMKTVRRAALAALADNRWTARGLSFAEAQLSLELADDARVAALNAEYRGKSTPTNVLSFPAHTPEDMPDAFADRHGPPPAVGDVILAYGVMRREAAEESKPLAHHTAHLVVHGTLHCLGYDHEEDAAAEEMEAAERRILARMEIPDPYAAAEEGR